MNAAAGLDDAALSASSQSSLPARAAWDSPIAEENATLHGLFAAQASRTPDAVAVICGPRQLTYRELNRSANAVARQLRRQGVTPETLVGLCVDRSVDLLVGMLGILKSGAAYLPLDPAQPDQRLAFFVNDSGAQSVITLSRFSDRFANSTAQLLSLESLIASAADDGNDDAQASRPSAVVRNLAYVMYTSGSTGLPKGVMIEHAAAVNTILDVNHRFQVQPTDRVISLSSFGFDLSVYDYFGLLAAGGAVVLPETQASTQPADWARLIRQHQVTIWNTVPTSLEALLSGYPRCEGQLLNSLRLVMLSGDWIPVALPGKFREHNRQAHIVSLGGATEASIWSILFPIGEVQADWKSIPYGKPMANQSLHVLDDRLRPCLKGETGQLYIGGHGLARGYLNRPELTAERFVEHPTAGDTRSRLYATGDLGRWLPDGNIEFLGRIDGQVKIRGYRIELGEIEAALCRHPAVREAVVVAHESKPGSKMLIAYLVQQGPQCPSPAELRTFLHGLLPHYMLPAQFTALGQLPLSAHGKVDRRALSLHDSRGVNLADNHVPASNPLEQQLATLWEDIFGRRPIGVEDDFFELGGDSLTAAALCARMAEELGRELTIDSLLEMPRIRQLCRFLSVPAANTFTPLVAIQPAGSRPAVFCVPGIAGSLMEFQQLATALGPDQPLFGFRTRGFDGRQLPHATIREMASDYLGAMRAVQPSGPYHLAGYSLGGVVAYEMARQLRAQQQRVELLAIFDSELWNSLPRLSQRIARHVRFFHRQDRTGKWRYLQTRFAAWMQPPETNDQSEDRIHKMDLSPLRAWIARTQLKALHAYHPSTYSGRLTLFVAEQRRIEESNRPCDPSLGWSRWAKSLEIFVSPGNHLTMLRRPHVELLAAQLNLCLDRAIVSQLRPQPQETSASETDGRNRKRSHFAQRLWLRLARS